MNENARKIVVLITTCYGTGFTLVGNSQPFTQSPAAPNGQHRIVYEGGSFFLETRMQGERDRRVELPHDTVVARVTPDESRSKPVFLHEHLIDLFESLSSDD